MFEVLASLQVSLAGDTETISVSLITGNVGKYRKKDRIFSETSGDTKIHTSAYLGIKKMAKRMFTQQVSV